MLALFTSLILVPLLQRWAFDAGALDLPDERKRHARPVPRIGGVAIILSWLFSLLVYVDMGREVRGILAGSLIVFCVGLVDDIHGLSPKKKFMGQVAAVLVTLSVGKVYIRTLGDLFGTGVVTLPEWIAIPFTVFAVVGVINAFNLMDGLDGLAGGISTIALSAFLILGLMTGNQLLVAMCAALLGGIVGFLKYNLYPARIFMGDTGSLTVGFIIAFLAVLLTQSQTRGVPPLLPVLVLGLPIADTFRVMGRRLLQRKSPFSPDRSHVHHRFLELGFQHRFTVIIIYGVSLFWSTFAILCSEWREPLLLAWYLAGTFAFYQGIHILRKNRDRIPFMKRDSPASFRSSALYRRISRLAVRTAPLILLLTVAYFLLAVLFSSEPDSMTLQAGLLLLGGLLALFVMTRDARNHFVQAMLAVAVLLISFVLNRCDDVYILFGMPLKHMEELLLISLGCLVLLRFTFHGPRESFLSSIDYLLIGVSLLFTIASPSLFGASELPETVVKGLVLFLALKTSMACGQRQARVCSLLVFAVLLAIVARGL